MTLEIVYETHAITVDNERGIATGWLPGRLSRRGREAARELGRRRSEDGLAAIYVSDLARARDTVSIAFSHAHVPVVVEPRLRECNYGDLNGAPKARLDRERAGHVNAPWPGGESYAMVVARTRDLLRDLVARHEGERILLVGHSATQLALDHLVLGRPLGPLVEAGMQWQPGWEYRISSEAAFEDPVEPTGGRPVPAPPRC